MRFVLDNSVVMRCLLRDGSNERLTYAEKVLALLTQESSEALVPGIWALEAANVLVKAQAKLLVTEARCAAFAALLQGMAITTDPHTAAHALSDTLQLARRSKLSAYDASYFELAMREDVPLATLDGDLRPTLGISKKQAGGKETPVERNLSEAEIKELNVKLNRSGLHPRMMTALRLILATGARVGEITKARWAEIDLTNNTWTIPADNAKNGRLHLIHLSDYALVQITTLKEYRSNSYLLKFRCSF